MQTFLGSSYHNVHTLCVYTQKYNCLNLYFLSREWHIVFVIFYYIYPSVFSSQSLLANFFKQMLYLRILCRSKKKQIFFYLKKKSYGWGIKLQSLIASVFVICSCMCICSHLLDLVVYIPDKRNIYRHTNINASSFEHCHVFLMGVDVRACIASFNQN